MDQIWVGSEAWKRFRSQMGGDLVAALRSQGPLSTDAQTIYDNAVTRVGMDQLAFIAALYRAGLDRREPNWWSAGEIANDAISSGGYAAQVMDPRSLAPNILPERKERRVPLYITIEDVTMGQRLLDIADRAGVTLRTDQVEEAVRTVNRTVEKTAIQGGITSGLLTHSGRTEVAFTSGTTWVGQTSIAIKTDVTKLVNANRNRNRTAPNILVLPVGYATLFSEDYKDNGDRSLRERILADTDMISDIVVSSQMPANTVALVEASSNTIDLIDGQQPTLVTWSTGNPFQADGRVLACQVVRIKADYDGVTGIVVGKPVL